MSDIVIRAAAWMGPDGFGNELAGLKRWPAPLADALRRGKLEELRWSSLFDSETQRFARMDWLSRLGLMAVELLDNPFRSRRGNEADAVEFQHGPPPHVVGYRRFADWATTDLEQTGVCVETKCGCLTSDAEFLQLTRPSVFAYTLPSTVIGEICIRHRFKGRMLCLMASSESTRTTIDEATNWLRGGDAKACLCVGCEAVSPAAAALLPPDMDMEHSWQAFALLLGKKSGAPRERPLSEGTLAEICRRACGAPWSNAAGQPAPHASLYSMGQAPVRR